MDISAESGDSEKSRKEILAADKGEQKPTGPRASFKPRDQ